MSNPKQEVISQMFDRIAGTYDSTNRVLSLRQDLRWRRTVADLLPTTPNLEVLDVATGTGDLLITMCERRPNITEAIGIDLSDKMLLIGQKKLMARGLIGRASLRKANAANLPFADGCFDVVTVAFGIRNVVDTDGALQEMRRVLKPGGLLLVLEFSLPSFWPLRMLYLLYFRYVLPLIGGAISRDLSAYRYLNQSVEAFVSPDVFKDTLMSRGFKRVDQTPLSFGIATIYRARIC